MFKVVRDSVIGFGHRLGSAWRDLRARGMVRLFLFEFAVVLLGVLAAQGLANWANERNARQRLEAALVRQDKAIRINIASAMGWRAAAPCFRERLRDIMRYAGQGRDVPSQWLARPSVKGTYATGLGDSEELILRRVYGDAEAYRYIEIEADRASLHRGAETITDIWLSLAVLDPELGEVTLGDRVNARHDAAQMLSALRRIEIVSGNIIAWAERND